MDTPTQSGCVDLPALILRSQTASGGESCLSFCSHFRNLQMTIFVSLYSDQQMNRALSFQLAIIAPRINHIGYDIATRYIIETGK
jgi:hypothetical protein